MNSSFIFNDASFDVFGLTFADKKDSNNDADNNNNGINPNNDSMSNPHESPHFFSIIVFDAFRNIGKKATLRFPDHASFEEAIADIRMGRSSKYTKLVPMSPSVTFNMSQSPNHDILTPLRRQNSNASPRRSGKDKLKLGSPARGGPKPPRNLSPFKVSERSERLNKVLQTPLESKTKRRAAFVVKLTISLNLTRFACIV